MYRQDMPSAFGCPTASGVLRQVPEDFFVDEVPSVEPDGQGEHVLIQIEKTNANTEWVAKQLARLAGVPRRDVSYAGLKDRNAVTRQWFSVRLAGKPEPDWRQVEDNEIRVLKTGRHSRKLKTGALKGNRFKLRLRQFDGKSDVLEQTLASIASVGIPNYFGEQRFGRDADNLMQAERLFKGELKKLSRHKKGIYLSAARSYLFNQVLAERVRQGTWITPLAGERMMLDGSRSSFLIEEINDELCDRLQRKDVHTSGPLWGRGEATVTADAAELEQLLLRDYELFREGLARAGLGMERRALRARVEELQWSINGDVMELSFFLPKGTYATVLLQQFVRYTSEAGVSRD